MARTRAPLNRVLVSATALVVGGAVAVAFVALRPDKPDARSSGYRITYAVEDLTSGARTTEVLEVDRLQVSRRLLERGGSATTQSGVYDRSPAGDWRQLAVVGPGEAGQDLQLLAPLAWAEDEKLATRDGTGQIAGRACTWWLTREPLDTATFAAATTTDRARTCVDDAGRLLADTWELAGREVRRRTATSVQIEVEISAFDGQEPGPLIGQLVTTAVQQIPEPAGDLIRPAAPAAWRLVSAVKLVDVAPGTTEVARRTERAVYLVDRAVVLLDQVREPVEAPEARGDREVDLGALGSGRVRATAAGLVVEVRVGDGLVRVRSGLAYDDLVTWLRSLSLGPAG